MKNKRLWFQLLAWILCVVIGYQLYDLIKKDNARNAERFLQLQLQANQQEQTDYEKQEAQVDIYDRFYSQLEVPHFICWGDSAMAGSRERSLSTALVKVTNDNLFSSLSKTFSRVIEQDGYSIPSVEATNMGVSNEAMRQILVRSGVNIMDLGEGIEIPSGTDPVTLRLMDQEAWDSEDKKAELKFAKQRDVSFGKVTIDGIKGTLITTDDWFDSTHPRYAFIRDKEGDWQRVGSGTEVEIETATKYLGDIPIFFFENDSGRSVDGLVSDMEKLVKRYANAEADDEDTENDAEIENDESSDFSSASYNLPFVVVCTTAENSNLDKALSSKFGDRYIRNDSFSNEMTDRMYRKLAQQVYDNLDQQGCFTELQAKIIMAIHEAEGI